MRKMVPQDSYAARRYRWRSNYQAVQTSNPRRSVTSRIDGWRSCVGQRYDSGCIVGVQPSVLRGVRRVALIGSEVRRETT